MNMVGIDDVYTKHYKSRVPVVPGETISKELNNKKQFMLTLSTLWVSVGTVGSFRLPLEPLYSSETRLSNPCRIPSY